MHPKKTLITKLTIIFATLFAFAGCEPKKVSESRPADFLQGNEEIAKSLINKVQRRRSQQLKKSLAKILVVDPNGMCLELGKHPCIDQVHRVDLGSMDAYNASQYQHPVWASAGSAGSLERVVLSACIMRSGMDLLNPKQGVIFKDIETSFDGRLIESPAIDQSIRTLYQRAFTREPTPQEVFHLRSMYEEIYKEEPIAAGRNWMVLSCFAVLSSVEMAFF